MRAFYELNNAFEVKDNRICAIDTSDNVVVLGDQKGYVFAYDESVGPRADGKGQETSYEMINNHKRGQEDIKQIMFLTRSMVIAILSKNGSV